MSWTDGRNPVSDQATGEPETTNIERAWWGMTSLAGLVATTGDNADVDLTPGADPRGAGHVLIDVLANLRHYADTDGIDFDAYDRHADEYYRSEIDPTIKPVPLVVAAYRMYVRQFTNPTLALLHLARTAAIAVAWLDRDCIERDRGTPLTDEQWARLAPPLESHDAHVSGSGDSKRPVPGAAVRQGRHPRPPRTPRHRRQRRLTTPCAPACRAGAAASLHGHRSHDCDPRPTGIIHVRLRCPS